MSKPAKTPLSKEDAFEIIELASQDIELLSRAFYLIAEVCEELENAGETKDDDQSQYEAKDLQVH